MARGEAVAEGDNLERDGLRASRLGRNGRNQREEEKNSRNHPAIQCNRR
jgi:hypothetical protein